MIFKLPQKPFYVISYINEKGKHCAIGVTTEIERKTTLNSLKKKGFCWSVTLVEGARNYYFDLEK